MKSLTIAYVTARQKPCITWFTESLSKQVKRSDPIRVVIVDLYANERKWKLPKHITHVEPKPTVWQGKHRVTKENWWAASNARNTAICMCESEWIAFLDDRCVLLPGWMDAVKRAMAGNYAVCGAYEKRTGITVEGGVIKHSGIVIGQDCREQYVNTNNMGKCVQAPGEWWFGCTGALPLEWALDVNGFDEFCDGLGYEDVFFGLFLANSGYPIKYDLTCKIIEDRTPGMIGPVCKKEDKGKSPNDKSHAQLAHLRGLKTACHPIDLRSIRTNFLAGKGWPKPWGPEKDYYDGQLIKDFA